MSTDGDASFGYDDHFTPARTRKKRKNRPPTQPPSPRALLDRTSEDLRACSWIHDAMQTLRDVLGTIPQFKGVQEVDVLCLGLGSLVSSRDARAQLAFLLAACDDLHLNRAKVSVYDPVFGEQDTALLGSLGLTALLENRHARYEIRTPTIVYMPHCDLPLYENLFGANWASDRLANILLIANRLSEYTESIPSRKLAAEHPRVARLAPYLDARPVPPCATYPNAFNNTAIQVVRAEALALALSSPAAPAAPHPGAPVSA